MQFLHVGVSSPHLMRLDFGIGQYQIRGVYQRKMESLALQVIQPVRDLVCLRRGSGFESVAVREGLATPGKVGEASLVCLGIRTRRGIEWVFKPGGI